MDCKTTTEFKDCKVRVPYFENSTFQVAPNVHQKVNEQCLTRKPTSLFTDVRNMFDTRSEHIPTEGNTMGQLIKLPTDRYLCATMDGVADVTGEVTFTQEGVTDAYVGMSIKVPTAGGMYVSAQVTSVDGNQIGITPENTSVTLDIKAGQTLSWVTGYSTDFCACIEPRPVEMAFDVKQYNYHFGTFANATCINCDEVLLKTKYLWHMPAIFQDETKWDCSSTEMCFLFDKVVQQKRLFKDGLAFEMLFGQVGNNVGLQLGNQTEGLFTQAMGGNWQERNISQGIDKVDLLMIADHAINEWDCDVVYVYGGHKAETLFDALRNQMSQGVVQLQPSYAGITFGGESCVTSIKQCYLSEIKIGRVTFKFKRWDFTHSRQFNKTNKMLDAAMMFYPECATMCDTITKPTIVNGIAGNCATGNIPLGYHESYTVYGEEMWRWVGGDFASSIAERMGGSLMYGGSKGTIVNNLGQEEEVCNAIVHKEKATFAVRYDCFDSSFLFTFKNC